MECLLLSGIEIYARLFVPQLFDGAKRKGVNLDCNKSTQLYFSPNIE